MECRSRSMRISIKAHLDWGYPYGVQIQINAYFYQSASGLGLSIWSADPDQCVFQSKRIWIGAIHMECRSRSMCISIKAHLDWGYPYGVQIQINAYFYQSASGLGLSIWSADPDQCVFLSKRIWIGAIHMECRSRSMCISIKAHLDWGYPYGVQIQINAYFYQSASRRSRSP